MANPFRARRTRNHVRSSHFAWGSDARGKAHVHVVVLGLAQRRLEPLVKRLFSYDDINGEPVESTHKMLSPYLIDASGLRDRHTVVEEVGKPIWPVPRVIIGSKPIDGGYLIFDSKEERDDFLEREPAAEPFVRPFVGGAEYIDGTFRWILALQKAPSETLRQLPAVIERLRRVREYRLGKIPRKRKQDKQPKPPGISARALAETPAAYHVTVIPTEPFLAIPEVSSERRTYVPIGWLKPPIIPSNKLRLVAGAEHWLFAVLTSAMHMSWTRNVGGRLESRYQYSIGINYNTFPWPEINDAARVRISSLARAVLASRVAHSTATLADLYDPDVMPEDLRRAHSALDAAVDALYRRGGFASDRERVEHLFALYEKAIVPLEAAMKKKSAPKRS